MIHQLLLQYFDEKFFLFRPPDHRLRVLRLYQQPLQLFRRLYPVLSRLALIRRRILRLFRRLYPVLPRLALIRRRFLQLCQQLLRPFDEKFLPFRPRSGLQRRLEPLKSQ